MSSRTFVDSSSLLHDAQALRAQAERDGYLFMRGLLPADAVRAVRRDALDVVETYGWRMPNQAAEGGKIDKAKIDQVPVEAMRTDIGVSIAAYDDAQKLESFHRLPHHPNLIHFFEMLFGGDVLVHPRHILRMITPHHAMTPTPPHQDFPLIQGSDHTWTAWFPLGDCPRELGALSVLRASHRKGYLPITEARGAGGIAVPLCPNEREWLSDDFEVGDVLIFTSYTLHRALPCKRQDEIRLSLDVRYQPAHEPVEAKSLLPHCDLSWEEIYANWTHDDLKYYWQRQPTAISAWDDTYLQPSRRIC